MLDYVMNMTLLGVLLPTCNILLNFQVNLWDKVLTSAEIGQLYEGCSSHQLGNVFAWPTAKYSLYGDIKPIEPSSLCTSRSELF